MKRITLVIISLLVLFSFQACGKQATSAPAVSAAQAESPATTDSIATDSTEVSSGTDTLTKINEVRNWLVSDVWNPMTSVRDYYLTGKGSAGEEVDIDFLISQLTKAMDKKAGYDAFMSSLPEEYADIQEYWGKISTQIDGYWAYIKEHPVEVTGETFSTDLFNQYFQPFDDAIFAQNEKN